MRITWDDPSERFFRAGVDRGVFYLRTDGMYPEGVAWNGLSAVNDSTSGRDMTVLYSGDIRRDYTKTRPERAGTVSCYTYPDEMEACIGGEEVTPGVIFYDQAEEAFGVTYRRMIGNAVEGNRHAYEIHILYNCVITGFKDSATTINSDASTDTLDFDFSAFPEDASNYSPVSHIVIRSDRFSKKRIDALEDVLYGTKDRTAYLPLPDDLLEILSIGGLIGTFDVESTFDPISGLTFLHSVEGHTYDIPTVDAVSSAPYNAGIDFESTASANGESQRTIDIDSNYNPSDGITFVSSADVG